MIRMVDYSYFDYHCVPLTEDNQVKIVHFKLMFSTPEKPCSAPPAQHDAGSAGVRRKPIAKQSLAMCWYGI